jgi:hypothetical protein
MNQVLRNKTIAGDFGHVVFDLSVAQMKAGRFDKGLPNSQRR